MTFAKIKRIVPNFPYVPRLRLLGELEALEREAAEITSPVQQATNPRNAMSVAKNTTTK